MPGSLACGGGEVSNQQAPGERRQEPRDIVRLAALVRQVQKLTRALIPYVSGSPK